MMMQLTQYQKDQFQHDGFFVLKNIIKPDDLAILNQAVEYLAKVELETGQAHHFSDDGKSQRIWNLLNKSQIFCEVIQHPLIMETMDWVFDRETTHQKFFLSSFQASILYPGAEAIKWHLDTPIPEPHPLWAMKANTIWLLDDFTENNGATEVVPGTHKQLIRPKADDPMLEKQALKVIAKAGDVLVTHGLLWHRGGHNQSQHKRKALFGSFAASYAREIANEENLSVVLDKQVVENASPTLQRILGLGHGIKPGSLSTARFEY
jgi:ectoine hydroxylase-related dioxygenase (phytanoyl-CoA dioxygenase family)